MTQSRTLRADPVREPRDGVALRLTIRRDGGHRPPTRPRPLGEPSSTSSSGAEAAMSRFRDDSELTASTRPGRARRRPRLGRPFACAGRWSPGRSRAADHRRPVRSTGPGRSRPARLSRGGRSARTRQRSPVRTRPVKADAPRRPAGRGRGTRPRSADRSRRIGKGLTLRWAADSPRSMLAASRPLLEAGGDLVRSACGPDGRPVAGRRRGPGRWRGPAGGHRRRRAAPSPPRRPGSIAGSRRPRVHHLLDPRTGEPADGALRPSRSPEPTRPGPRSGRRRCSWRPSGDHRRRGRSRGLAAWWVAATGRWR